VDAPGGTLHSRSDVATPRADHWVARLAAEVPGEEAVHEVAEEAGWTVVRLAGGSCAMTGRGDAVVLEASAPDAATLARVQNAVGGLLERLAAAEGLRVRWERREM
jgi:hypothetical protein